MKLYNVKMESKTKVKSSLTYCVTSDAGCIKTRTERNNVVEKRRDQI